MIQNKFQVKLKAKNNQKANKCRQRCLRGYLCRIKLLRAGVKVCIVMNAVDWDVKDFPAFNCKLFAFEVELVVLIASSGIFCSSLI